MGHSWINGTQLVSDVNFIWRQKEKIKDSQQVIAIVILLSTRGTADSDNWHLPLLEKAAGGVYKLCTSWYYAAHNKKKTMLRHMRYTQKKKIKKNKNFYLFQYAWYTWTQWK